MRPETGRIQELRVQPFGSSAAAGSDAVLIATNRADRTLISAVEAVTRGPAFRRLDRIGKDFEHGVPYGESKGPTHWCE
jgi:hypothetical protein